MPIFCLYRVRSSEVPTPRASFRQPEKRRAANRTHSRTTHKKSTDRSNNESRRLAEDKKGHCGCCFYFHKQRYCGFQDIDFPSVCRLPSSSSVLTMPSSCKFDCWLTFELSSSQQVAAMSAIFPILLTASHDSLLFPLSLVLLLFFSHNPTQPRNARPVMVLPSRPKQRRATR